METKKTEKGPVEEKEEEAEEEMIHPLISQGGDSKRVYLLGVNLKL